MPLLDAVTTKTGTLGRPHKRPKVLAADKGDDAKALRQRVRQRGIRSQLPKRLWKTSKPRGRPLKIDVPRFQSDALSPSSRTNYVDSKADIGMGSLINDRLTLPTQILFGCKIHRCKRLRWRTLNPRAYSCAYWLSRFCGWARCELFSSSNRTIASSRSGRV